MINFSQLEKNIVNLSTEFNSAVPYNHVVIDNFCNGDIHKALESFPEPIDGKIGKSRDYIFAKNKYEKSNFKECGKELNELYDDFISNRFKEILCQITKEEIFLDNSFHGGGIHQGGKESFLDMHVDFNYHPINKDWFRNLNILLYMNKDWIPEYKGELELKNKLNNKRNKIEPIFNRCIIMFTRDYTLHGYQKTNFPDGSYRRSIAAYAYSLSKNKLNKEKRSTVWYPENTNILKRTIGKLWPKLVFYKNKFFGSSTSKN